MSKATNKFAPEVIRLMVMMYFRFPPSLKNVDDLFLRSPHVKRVVLTKCAQDRVRSSVRHGEPLGIRSAACC
jgi:hypothetical protein